jgi:hypothetical protein
VTTPAARVDRIPGGIPRPVVEMRRDGPGEGWLTLREGRPGYLFAPHHGAFCPCGARRDRWSPLCWECHLAVLGEVLS